MVRFIKVLVALLLFSGSGAAVYWHFSVFETVDALEQEFEQLAQSETQEQFSERSERLRSRLENAGYSESVRKLDDFSQQHSDSLPSTAAFQEFNASAVPKECPCRLTLALVLLAAGSSTMLIGLRRHSRSYAMS